MPDDDLRALAEEYWDTLLEANPTAASLLGDHRFDDRIEDHSPAADADLRGRWQSILDRMASIDRSRLDVDDGVTAGQLAAELGDAIAAIDIRLVELRSDQMTGFHVDLLQSQPVTSVPDPDAAGRIVERFRQVPHALDQVAQRFVEGAGAGRTPPAICVSRSINVIEGYLSSPLDGDVFATLAGPADWDGEDGWRATLRQVSEDVIRPAYRRFADRLRTELLPVGRDDEHCGLSWLSDGPELYATLIAHHTSLDLAPEEIHAIGLEEVTGTLPAQYADIGGRLFGTTDPAAVLERLRTDPSLRYVAGDEIRADARRALESASSAMAGWFGRLPEAP